ncbi:metallo-beta-lactamase family protein [Anaerosolibacter carboniphilus]|uniref:Metallo-beta-lactamase family protein n=1 Tax=Anaerosolibacter carboniphilus TaxID=1417629 RepID=A0A841L222_9FIRM|nr:MBL fold metallo-hydrolase [Anaerosolibacter carboniphilus]MBB6217212.1 metallo-beta-lactamase family protein [Anaerosolibacter carboniphilus]
MKISFLGAAQMVTGSNYLITTDTYKILLDCGQFQGGKETEKLNALPFPFSPSEIDFLILSHAHIDHSGRIPKLAKEGFRGKIICTRATADLASILLKDSGHIHEMEAVWENRKRLRAGLDPVEPLYRVEDAENSLQFLNPILYDQKIDLTDSISLRFQDAGHILGSSIVELWIREENQETKLVFSGDLGSKDRPLLRNPSLIEDADYLILESTYGNRLHEEPEKRVFKLMDIISKTIARGGTVIIPSFAVGRTQELIYELNKYYDHKEMIQDLLKVPVYVDSPMATSATEIFRKHADCFDEETRGYILSGDNPLDFHNLRFTKTAEESRLLNASEEPKIIISASGMCEAGRIKHHLKHHLWKKNSSVIFVGYQAEGTLGRSIKDGAENVKIFGEKIQIRAEIHSIEGFSGHADQSELLDWLRSFKKPPKKIFIVHGEPDASTHFAHMIRDTFDIETVVPKLYESFELNEYGVDLSKSIPKIIPGQAGELDASAQNMLRDLNVAIDRIHMLLSTDLSAKDYQILKNKLIQLEKDVIDLNMLLGDK